MPEGLCDRWSRIDRIWNEALALDQAERATFLERACAGDAALRREIESLLQHDGAAEQFLEHPALHQIAAAIAEEQPSMIGREIGGYRLLSLLGTGGMGEVYRATELALGRDVALKILEPPSLALNPAYVRRFEEEARAASCLNHPNIVTIYAVGQTADTAYIAMELVQGRTLRELLAAGDLTIEKAIEYGSQLADALAGAHGAGIVHRDLKPENVMVTPAGLLKVLDFGIAKRGVAGSGHDGGAGTGALERADEHGVILGTTSDMSPEQALGRPVDYRSDQFSLGAMLYELVSGRCPFERSSRAETIAAIVRDGVPPLSSVNGQPPLAVQQVIARCLQKNPADRYHDVTQLAGHLQAIRNHRNTGHGELALTRRRILAWGVGTAAAAGVGAIAWRLWPWPPAFQRLAVLPFANPVGDEDVDYLCEGIADSLIRRLSGVPALKVQALSTVMHMKSADPRAAARQLNVDAVLTGSVSRRAGRLIVSAELVDAASGARLWGDTFNRPQTDVLAVQDEIAGAIVAQAIQAPPRSAEEQRAGGAITDDPHAYDQYLQAVHYIRLERENDYLAARRLLQDVVARDPRFALAYVTLASTYSVMAIDGYEAPSEAWPQQSAHIARALELDPDLPDAHAEATAAAFYYRWDWADAARDWQRALASRRGEIQPELLTANALQLWALGKNDEALKFARAARLADPLSAACTLREADVLAQMHDLESAARLYDKVIAAEPNDPRAYFGLAEVRRRQGRFDEAIAVRRRAHDTLDDTLLASLPSVTGAAGYRQIEEAEALSQLAVLGARTDAGMYVSPLDYARVHAQLGHAQPAFEFLDRALEDRAAGLVFLKVDPAWEAMREAPRFTAAVRRVGLP